MQLCSILRLFCKGEYHHQKSIIHAYRTALRELKIYRRSILSLLVILRKYFNNRAIKRRRRLSRMFVGFESGFLVIYYTRFTSVFIRKRKSIRLVFLTILRQEWIIIIHQLLYLQFDLKFSFSPHKEQLNGMKWRKRSCPTKHLNSIIGRNIHNSFTLSSASTAITDHWKMNNNNYMTDPKTGTKKTTSKPLRIKVFPIHWLRRKRTKNII